MNPRGRRSVLPVIAAVLAIVSGAGFGRDASAADRTVRLVSGARFVEKDKYIEAGDTVTWVYDDSSGAPHTVTRDSSPDRFDSSPANCPRTNPLAPDDCIDSDRPNFTHRFDTPGDYPYFCKIHRSQGMVGTIHVKAKVVSSPSPSPKPTKSPSSTPSPSPSGSPSPSPSGSGLESPVPSFGASATPSVASPAPRSSGSGAGKAAIALLSLVALGGAGYFVYLRFLAG